MVVSLSTYLEVLSQDHDNTKTSFVLEGRCWNDSHTVSMNLIKLGAHSKRRIVPPLPIFPASPSISTKLPGTCYLLSGCYLANFLIGSILSLFLELTNLLDYARASFRRYELPEPIRKLAK